jgi:hypothetical protein
MAAHHVAIGDPASTATSFALAQACNAAGSSSTDETTPIFIADLPAVFRHGSSLTESRRRFPRDDHVHMARSPSGKMPRCRTPGRAT